ncbi:sigma-70 family RNA polymerase sigma factor [Dactylosporangium sp. CA-092794]|uniref:sigma-70 family RNA polymerase sigma factor n=1 Tax=Dactylosporangium sp. CA-092794 TaxID=3239929 RepID=UPI003D8C3992
MYAERPVRERATSRPSKQAPAAGGIRADAAADRLMREIYRVHVPALMLYLLRLNLDNESVAEDIMQETIVRAWKHMDQLLAAPQSVRPWLFTVARNKAIDLARARRARPVEPSDTDFSRVAMPGDAVDRMLTSATVRRALHSLSPEHRTVIAELYFRGSTLAEAAARIGVPTGTVKSRAHYALVALRRAIGSVDA